MSANEQVYHPNMKEKTGLFCFMDKDRACGTDCMAFQTMPMAKGPDYDERQWAHCTVLVSLHQGSKHMVAVANTLLQIGRHQRTPGIPAVK